MNKRAAIVILALLAVVPLARAQTPEGKVYTPGHFRSIEITGSAIVRFIQGANEQVFVEGGEETQGAVELEARNGVLIIHPGGSWKFWNAQRIRITVTAPELTRVTISGSADLHAAAPVQVNRLSIQISGAGLARFDQLRAEQLSFQVSGSGDGQMAGVAKELAVTVSGRGEFRGENLMSERAKVAVSGVGDVKVWASQDLSIAVSGVGAVDYWGAPTVRRGVSGRATINDRGPKPAPP